MKIEIETAKTVGDLIDLTREQFLRVNHEYQRGLRWTETQKQMFIDSILRGYSIPAFYLHEKSTSAGGKTNTNYDIVDGQQRIDAIYTYSESAYSLLNPSDESDFRFPNFVKNAPCPWGGKRFDELTQEQKDSLMEHIIVVNMITTDNENEIRDLFIRLQGGTPLTPQDKRDSWPGNFTEFVLKIGGKSGVAKWYGNPLFTDVAKVTNESRRRQLAAQVFMLFSTLRNENKFCDIKSTKIDEFYHSQVGFDTESPDAKRFLRVCDTLGQAFNGKPRIFGHYIIHSLLLADSLLEEFVRGWEDILPQKLEEFDQRRLEASRANKKREDSEFSLYYSEYGRLTQTQSDNAVTISRRHAFFTQEMLKLLSVTLKDRNRAFSELQRRTVFFRDLEFCQWCRMNKKEHKVPWGECEIHHIQPHADGGQTSIENAVLMHRDCHPKNNQDVEQFNLWSCDPHRYDLLTNY